MNRLKIAIIRWALKINVWIIDVDNKWGMWVYKNITSWIWGKLG